MQHVARLRTLIEVTCHSARTASIVQKDPSASGWAFGTAQGSTSRFDAICRFIFFKLCRVSKPSRSQLWCPAFIGRPGELATAANFRLWGCWAKIIQIPGPGWVDSRKHNNNIYFFSTPGQGIHKHTFDKETTTDPRHFETTRSHHRLWEPFGCRSCNRSCLSYSRHRKAGSRSSLDLMIWFTSTFSIQNL